MNQKVQKGKYRHYKGKEYELLGLANHSETLEPLVVYKALYDSDEFGSNALWVRPLSMFTEEIEIDSKKIPRFKYLG
jgi:cyclomaltodextrinase / maltogenic alpha-amylase / neopullulanase